MDKCLSGTRRGLERSVATRARLSFNLESPVTAMCRIDNTHCLAVAGQDGHLQVLRVYSTSSGTSTKYSRIESVRSWQADSQEGHVTFVHHLKDSLLLIATSTSIVGLLDLRTMEISQRYSASPRIWRHHIDMPIDTLDSHRHGSWHPFPLGSSIWALAKVLASGWSIHFVPDSPDQRSWTMAYGLCRTSG